MITRPTVMVLGAGASAPYGLPLGSELRTLILAMNEAELNTLPIGVGQQRDPGTPYNFRDTFRRSQAYSIDAFLARRPVYVDLGKHAIAAALLPKESLAKLVQSDPEDHWYRYLAHAMDAPWEKFGENQICFITFNYDRSLEVFLVDMMVHRFGKSQDEAMQMLERFPIVHVYGSLGSINPNDKDFVPYGGGDFCQQHYRTAASGLRIIDEGRHETKEFDIAKRLIAQSDALCFLGFAFDPMNVERLGGTNINAGWHRGRGDGGLRSTTFAASAFGFTDAEMYEALGRIAPSESAAMNRDRIKDLKSLALLRETNILR